MWNVSADLVGHERDENVEHVGDFEFFRADPYETRRFGEGPWQTGGNGREGVAGAIAGRSVESVRGGRAREDRDG